MFARIRALSKCNRILTMRFHGVVLSSLLRKKVVAIAYDYKHTELMELLGKKKDLFYFGIRHQDFFDAEFDLTPYTQQIYEAIVDSSSEGIATADAVVTGLEVAATHALESVFPV